MFFNLKDNNGKDLLNLNTHYLDTSYVTAPHTHHFLEISCVKAGNSTYYVDEKLYDMQTQDVFLFNNQEPHYIHLKQGEKIVNMVIHFEPEFIWNNLSGGIDYNFLKIFFERSSSFTNRLDRNNPATKKIYNMLLDIEEEFLSQRPAFELMIKIKLQSIFVEIMRNYDYINQTENEVYIKKDKQAINKVFGFIDDNISSDIKLDELANVALMSPSYFSALFKKYNGITPFEYVAKKRIQKSIELIKSTDKSMTEVATACGFNNSTNFIKCFKKVTGRTPSQYRSRGQIR